MDLKEIYLAAQVAQKSYIRHSLTELVPNYPVKPLFES